jgi:hypothetical protein
MDWQLAFGWPSLFWSTGMVAGLDCPFVRCLCFALPNASAAGAEEEQRSIGTLGDGNGGWGGEKEPGKTKGFHWWIMMRRKMNDELVIK